MKFKGSKEEFKQIVSVCGFDGEWVDNDSMLQFKERDGGIVNLFNNGTVQVQGKQEGRQKMNEVLLPKLEQPINRGAERPVFTNVVKKDFNQTDAEKDKQKVFVVYGHDISAREQLELILMKLGLDPFILSNTSGHGLTIIEALENEIVSGEEKCKFGIVLLTPDDTGYPKDMGPDSAEPRARQNVVLEMGMLLSSLGRGNVAILKKGHLEVPSDAQGILYIPFNDHVKETVPKLIDRLDKAGFELKAEAISKAHF